MDELNNNNEFNAEPVNQGSANIIGAEKGTPVFGIVSIITGGLGLLIACCIPYLPILLGLAGVVFGIVALIKKEKLIGLAIAGLICGGIAFIIGVLAAIGLAALGNTDWAEYFKNLQ